ncbi:Crp/Fnr family transcriptional regulator [Umezawaea tangerina]|uniref:Crp/Fnr family transcriptional regulator n=1 Tax=Umezawaea tangerina TaxID=84725 RepID=UPI001472CFE7|nr:Crp/Fnr family transcriptional regulator [Umezawaea tangerina]
MHSERNWLSDSFLRKLHTVDVKALFDVGHRIRFATGVSLTTQGEATPSVRVVLSGAVKVFRLAQPESTPMLVNLGGPGELLGVEAVLLRKQSHTGHVASIPTECLVINQSTFRNFVDDRPPVKDVLLAIMAKQLTLREVALAFATHNVRRRLLAFLARLQFVYGKDSLRGTELDLGLSHGDLAAAVGASEASVATVLAELKQEQVLSTGYKKIYVKQDLRKLLRKPEAPNTPARPPAQV